MSWVNAFLFLLFCTTGPSWRQRTAVLYRAAGRLSPRCFLPCENTCATWSKADNLCDGHIIVGWMDGWMDGRTYRFPLYSTRLRPLRFSPGPLPCSYNNYYFKIVEQGKGTDDLWATGWHWNHGHQIHDWMHFCSYFFVQRVQVGRRGRRTSKKTLWNLQE